MKIINSIYKLLKILLLLATAYLGYCTYYKFQNGWNSLTSFFQVPQALKDFMNKPIGKPVVVGEEHIGIVETKETGNIKTVPGGQKTHQTSSSAEHYSEKERNDSKQEPKRLPKQFSVPAEKSAGKKEVEKKNEATGEKTVIQVINQMPPPQFSVTHYVVGTAIVVIIIWWLFPPKKIMSNHKFSGGLSPKLPELPCIKLGDVNPKLNIGVGDDEEEDNDDDQSHQEETGEEAGNQVVKAIDVKLKSYKEGDLPAAQERYGDNLQDNSLASDQASASSAQRSSPYSLSEGEENKNEVAEFEEKHQKLPKEILGSKNEANAVGGAFLIQKTELGKSICLAKYEAKLANYKLQQKANVGTKLPRANKRKSLNDLKKELNNKRALAARAHLANWKERVDEAKLHQKKQQESKKERDNKRHTKAKNQVKSALEKNKKKAEDWSKRSKQAKENKQEKQSKYDEQFRRRVEKFNEQTPEYPDIATPEQPKLQKTQKERQREEETRKRRTEITKALDDLLAKQNKILKVSQEALKKWKKTTENTLGRCEAGDEGQTHTIPGDGPVLDEDGNLVKQEIMKSLASTAVSVGVTELMKTSKTVYDQVKKVTYTPATRIVERQIWGTIRVPIKKEVVERVKVDTKTLAPNALSFIQFSTTMLCDFTIVGGLVARGAAYINGDSYDPQWFKPHSHRSVSIRDCGTKGNKVTYKNVTRMKDGFKEEKGWIKKKFKEEYQKEQVKWVKGKGRKIITKHCASTAAKSIFSSVASSIGMDFVFDAVTCVMRKEYIKAPGRDGEEGTVRELTLCEKLERRVKRYDISIAKSLGGTAGSMAAGELVRRWTEGMDPRFQSVVSVASMAVSFGASNVTSRIAESAYNSLKSFAGGLFTAQKKVDDAKSSASHITAKLNKISAKISTKFNTNL